MIPERDPLPDDALFELLGNHRRRLLLRHLFDSDGGVPLRELSRDIVAHETDDADDADEEQVTSAYVSLYQTHVPLLEEHGVVEYDDAERVVSLGERSDRLLSVLAGPEPPRRRWAVYYLTVALALALVVLGSAVRPVPVPDALVAASTVGATAALVGLSLGRYYDARVRGPDGPLIDESPP